MKSLFKLTLAGLAAGFMAVTAVAQEVAQEVDRTVLPLKAPWYPPITTLDARDAKAPPVFEVKAPKDAPNVVVICWMISVLAVLAPSAA